MKKTLIIAILFMLALIIPLSVWANFFDLLIDPATLHIGTGSGTLNVDGNIRNNPVHIASNHFITNQNDGDNKFIIDKRPVLLLALPNRMFRMMYTFFTANPSHPFLEDTGTSINEAADFIPNNYRGYLNGALHPTKTMKDTQAVVGLGVFTNNSMNIEHFMEQPLPDDAVNFEFGVDSFGMYTYCLNTRASANEGPRNLADIVWPHNGLPSRTFITANSIYAGETRLFFMPFTEFGMVKNVLEPGTMLLLGSCLLGLGLFAIKFRK